jgi:hypothetical protein
MFNEDLSPTKSRAVTILGLAAALLVGGLTPACGLNPQPLPPDTYADGGVPIGLANPSVDEADAGAYGGGAKNSATSSSASGTGTGEIPPSADAGGGATPGTGLDAGHRGSEDAAADAAAPWFDAAADAERGDSGAHHDASADVREDAPTHDEDAGVGDAAHTDAHPAEASTSS